MQRQPKAPQTPWTLTAPTDTAVVVFNYRTQALTVDAVASALSEPEVTEVVVVDNASGDGSADWLEGAARRALLPLTVVRNPQNAGFAGGKATAASAFEIL